MTKTTSGDSNATAAAFLVKLYTMLEDHECQPYIAWQPDGRSFLIKKVNELCELVLPKYFKHNNAQSFIRQLNMYSFSKTRHDSNHREFHCENFVKGCPELLPLIKRKSQRSAELGDGTSATPGISGGNLYPEVKLSHDDSFDDTMHDSFDTTMQNGVISQLNKKIRALEKEVITINRNHAELLSKHNAVCAILRDLAELLRRQTHAPQHSPLERIESTSTDAFEPISPGKRKRGVSFSDTESDVAGKCVVRQPSSSGASSSLPISRMVSTDSHDGYTPSFDVNSIKEQAVVNSPKGTPVDAGIAAMITAVEIRNTEILSMTGGHNYNIASFATGRTLSLDSGYGLLKSAAQRVSQAASINNASTLSVSFVDSSSDSLSNILTMIEEAVCMPGSRVKSEGNMPLNPSPRRSANGRIASLLEIAAIAGEGMGDDDCHLNLKLP